MKNNKVQLALTILFFGAIWGIVEASVGYLLHFLPIFWAGTIMFPFVSYLLYKAYQRTKSRTALIWIGFVAALIKGINLFFPGYIFKTINPMISIIFEALMVMAVITMLDKEKLGTRMLALPIASVAWRVLYIAYMGVQYLATGFVAAQVASFYAAFEYVIIGGLLSAAIINLALFAEMKLSTNKTRTFNLKITPVLSAATMAVAIAVTILL